MTEQKEATPRERLEFSITNKPPLTGDFNGKQIEIRRIRLSEIADTWSEILSIIKVYYSKSAAIRSEAGDGSGEAGAVPAEDLFSIIDDLGPNAIEIVYTFLKKTTTITDTGLDDADFWSLVELLIIVLEHNVGKELVDFFKRGGAVLATLGLMPDLQDSKPNNSLSSGDGAAQN